MHLSSSIVNNFHTAHDVLNVVSSFYGVGGKRIVGSRVGKRLKGKINTIFTQYKMKSLPLSARFDLLNYATFLNAVCSNS